MANLITVKAFRDYDGVNYSPSKSLVVNVVDIQGAEANSSSGISGVNTSLYVKHTTQATTRITTLLVNEAASAIVTAANAALA